MDVARCAVLLKQGSTLPLMSSARALLALRLMTTIVNNTLIGVVLRLLAIR